jgi:thiol-disulfide isomerase/thioredoxin
MANLITYINTLLKPYYTLILIVVLLIFFLGVARYTYEKFFAKTIKNKKYSDVANTPDRKSVITIFFFSVDWCPHCIKAKPEWNNFKQQYSDKLINGYVIKTYDIDCTDDNGDSVEVYLDDNGKQATTKPTSMRTADIIKKYKIESYPTIKLIKDGTTVEFDAKVTNENLSKFVNSV